MNRSALSRAAGAAVGTSFLLAAAARGQALPGPTLQIGMPAANASQLSLATSLPRSLNSNVLQISPAIVPAANVVIPVNTGTPFTINLNVGPTLAANPAALGAFVRAAGAWTSTFRDPVTVNIDADLASLPFPTIGSTNAVFLVGGYDEVRNAMVDDAATNEPARDAIVASLPTAGQFSAWLPAGITLSGGVETTKAAFKAQGFTGLDEAFGTSDASITFSNFFPFDFDRSDGISPGTIDFQTVATHEIGHVLGFDSAVDVVDFAVANNLTGELDVDALDLFRFGLTRDHPATTADFLNNPRDLLAGEEAVTDDIDNEYRMSTGAFTGDGNQASHWKDDAILGGAPIGIMDPTLDFGQIEDISPADIRALDLIGWDVNAPEPASLALLAVGGLLLVRRRRKGT